MERRRWLFFAVVNSVLVCCIVAKPFSLNELIEAESNQKEVYHTTSLPKLEESTGERFSLNKGLTPLNRLSRKLKETGSTLSLFPLGKKISPLKYRKAYQIKSPLKPKRVKQSLRTRHKRKNQSVKTEVDGNAILNQKYIPLLRSLGMLFDNILGSESGESPEITKGKRLRYYFEDDAPCKCTQGESTADTESEEETVVPTEIFSIEVPITTEAPATTTDNTPVGDIRSIRRNKNVPVLLPRNTVSTGRNDHGLGKGSSTAHHGSDQGYITWVNGNSEHNPEWEQVESNAQSDERHTVSDSRYGASSVSIRRTIRDRGIPGNITKENETVNENYTISKETEDHSDDTREYLDEFHGQDKFKTGGDETESSELLLQPVRGQRGFTSEGKVDDIEESIQSKEDDQESYLDVPLHSSNGQRIPDRDGAFTSEVQKAVSKHETVTDTQEKDISQYNLANTNKTRNGPVVVIIDGYSVTRHKNGENKLAEKAIRIRP